MRCFKIFIAVAGCALVLGCGSKPKKTPMMKDADVIHNNIDQLTQVIIYDVFSPPVASRIYGYTSLAAYEAIRYSNPEYNSITAQLRGFGKPPEPKAGVKYNYTLAATSAFFAVAHKVTFSIDSLKKYEARVYAMYKDNMDDSTYARSMAFGEKIGKYILKRAAVDNYPQTRGKPRFLGNDNPGNWHPTPPDYLDGVEFCWGTMHTFAVDTSTMFPLPPPPAFSEDKNSEYFRQTMEVYNQSKNITPEQKTIAKFWDDNPFVIGA